MKRVLIAGVATLALFAGGAANALELKLSHSHQANLDSDIHTTAWTFKNYLAEIGADIDVTIYPNNELGQEREVYEAMQLGSGASCTITGTAILGNFNSKIGILDLPFLWKDYAHVAKILDGEVGSALAEELKPSGLEVVAWLNSWGYRNVASAGKPIETVEDLQGMKIRTIPTKTYIETINTLGANATPMAFGEIYTAMETGVLDGLEHNANVVLSNKFQEVAPNYALTRHLYGPLVFACSSTFMSSLSDEQKADLAEAAEFARDVQRGLSDVRDAKSLKALEKVGVTITAPDLSPIVPKAIELQDELAKEMGVSDLLQKIRDQG